MKVYQIVQDRLQKHALTTHLFSAIRLGNYWLALLAILLFTPASASASSDVSKTKGKGLNISDPIAANTGGFYWEKRLLNLGGPLPLTFDVSHYMNDIGDGKLYLNIDNTFSRWEGGGYQGITFELGIRRASPQVVYNSTLGYYREYSFSKSGRQYVAKETDGYVYLQDPIAELIYIFENTGRRLRWIMDRKGNYLTFAYLLPGDTRPTMIYEREAGADDRMMLIQQQEASGARAVSAAEMLWDPIEENRTAGRQVIVGEQNPGTGYLLHTVQDAKGGQTTFSWSSGWPPYITSYTLPKGNSPFTQTAIWRQYFDGGSTLLVTSQTDAYGNTVDLSYSSSNYGTYVQEDRPDGATVTYHHSDRYAPPSSLVDAEQNQAAFTTDSKDRLTSITDRMSGQTALSYDPSGKLASLTNARGNAINNIYTAQDQIFTNPVNAEQVTFTFHNLTRTDYPDGTNEQFGHDANGNVTSRIDRTGQSWNYTYNSRGQMLTSVNPSGGVTTYTYNADGTLASNMDSATSATTYAYDQHKRLASVTHPGGTRQMAYDDNDNLTSVTDERSHITQYTYDANDNLSGITLPTGATRTYAYDLMDRLVSVTDENGQVFTRAYDAVGRLASVTDPHSHQTQFGYNTRGWLTHLTDPAGYVWLRDYDDEGLPTHLTTPLGHVTEIGYDVLGYQTSVADPLDHQSTMTRDSMTRITQATDPLNRTTAYAYDGNDNLTGVTLHDGTTATYQYNPLGLLSRITDPNGKYWQFAYTNMGRLNQLTDPLGRQTQYAYDARGRLATVTYPDTVIQTQTYDRPATSCKRRIPAAPRWILPMMQ